MRKMVQTKFGKRSVYEVGSEYPALVATLPKVWVESNDIDKDSKLEMEMTEKGHLILKPVGGGEISDRKSD